MTWIDAIIDPILGNVIGGSAAQAVLMGSLFLISILVVLLLAARIDLEIALLIVSPAIIVASFANLLPPLAFGVMVFLIALFFAGIIMAIAR